MAELGYRCLGRDDPVAASDDQAHLIERLVAANLQSLQLAKRLMRAQEVADAESVRAERAVDRAVAHGDPAAIDAAVDAVRASDMATASEERLSYRWAVHRCEVARLTQSARQLLRRGLEAEQP